MAMKNGVNTARERIFADVMSITTDATYAAAQAGYAHPAVAAHKLKNNESVMDLVRQQTRLLLRTRGAEVGANTLISIALDPKQPAGARVSAAKELVKASGIVADQDTEPDYATLPVEQLQRMLEEAKRAYEERIRPTLELTAGDSAQNAQPAPNLWD